MDERMKDRRWFFILLVEYDKSLEQISKKLQAKLRKSGNAKLRIYGDIPHSDVQDILSRSDIGLCLLDYWIPNYRYAYPVEIVEYMKAGLIVCFYISAMVLAALCITNNVTGFMTDYSVNKFSKAVNSAISLCMDAVGKE
ncbi:hypothetical protein [Thiohalophilus sp.]|uniref:hypothetical protein n=1 Tax=Thiohalophilus sp. TaxID=3028392 RepID=UPI002ACEB320|nr:hypothetical protein [Thiohalophilus sp.]MDZ7804403.1 hypothetical protein [Thiohalophilus sp.]